MDIEYLLWLQNIRESAGPWLTELMLFFSKMAFGTLVLIIMALVYWCWSKKLGIRMLLSLNFGIIVSVYLKGIFCVDRPWVRDSRITPPQEALPTASGYSFPSGHSQMGVCAYGTAAFWFWDSSRLIAWIGLALCILIPISRNFLGVHTPQDVVVGVLIGLLFIWIFIQVEKKIEKTPKFDLVVAAVGILLTVGSIIFAQFKNWPLVYQNDGSLLVDPFYTIKDYYEVGGICIGTIIGWILERRYVQFNDAHHWKAFLIRGGIGVVVVLGIYELLKLAFVHLHPYASCFLSKLILMFIVMFVWPLVFNAIEKKWLKGSDSVKIKKN